MTRQRILCLVRYYLPGYKSGGPIRTIANMVERLSDWLEFSIITADRDHADEQSYSGVRVDDWNEVGNAKVFYASPDAVRLRSLASLIARTPHDILYLNSFFDTTFTLRALLARRLRMIPRRPVVLAPRGEFSPGALALKASRKNWYRRLSAGVGLHRNLIWQASSEYEAREMRTALGATVGQIAIAPDLPPAPSTATSGGEHVARLSSAALRVCFLSRISPKKNLDFALRILGRVRVAVEFDIYGPIEDAGYWQLCQKVIATIRPPVRVSYRGSVPHDCVASVLRGYDLFFFPTHGENFGHVILESLLAGTPVLIADTTPWRQLRDLGIGWDLPLNEEPSFVAAIESASSLTSQESLLQRRHVRAYAENLLNDRAVVDANLDMFASASGRGTCATQSRQPAGTA
jgi:glycosyltransferase involved in cell wall biosynthesis